MSSSSLVNAHIVSAAGLDFLGKLKAAEQIQLDAHGSPIFEDFAMAGLGALTRWAGLIDTPESPTTRPDEQLEERANGEMDKWAREIWQESHNAIPPMLVPHFRNDEQVFFFAENRDTYYPVHAVVSAAQVPSTDQPILSTWYSRVLRQPGRLESGAMLLYKAVRFLQVIATYPDRSQLGLLDLEEGIVHIFIILILYRLQTSQPTAVTVLHLLPARWHSFVRTLDHEEYDRLRNFMAGETWNSNTITFAASYIHARQHTEVLSHAELAMEIYRAFFLLGT
ncbi:hypothetical protein JCM11641_006908 [Rhodosporidiobolus odoratus]